MSSKTLLDSWNGIDSFMLKTQELWNIGTNESTGLKQLGEFKGFKYSVDTRRYLLIELNLNNHIIKLVNFSNIQDGILQFILDNCK